MYEIQKGGRCIRMSMTIVTCYGRKDGKLEKCSGIKARIDRRAAGENYVWDLHKYFEDMQYVDTGGHQSIHLLLKILEKK